MSNGSLEGRKANRKPVLFETAAQEVFTRHGRVWKPSTLTVNRRYLHNQILPWFRGRPIDEITRGEVRQWFGTLHRTPAAANRSLPVLSVILREAEAYGYRSAESNPCRRIRRYREVGRKRFLNATEIRRLGRVLADRRTAWPLQATLVRLLLLTGCRQSEVRTLEWHNYRDGHLHLRDSKTGPRTIWLSSAARRELGELSRTGRFVFPAPDGASPMPTETLYRAWRHLRHDAGMPGLRLHDLRHTYASLALRRGETVVVIGRLLGHRDPNTTLKYTHFGSTILQEAAEIVTQALKG